MTETRGPSSPTDSLGCSLNGLNHDETIVSRTITFYRKTARDGAPGEVTMPETDRGFLIGLSRRGGHRRRIFHAHHAIEAEFEENSLYVRRLSDRYRAELAGSFDFMLAEISPASFVRLADEVDRPDVSELADVTTQGDAVLGGLMGALFSTSGQPARRSALFIDQISVAVGMHLLQTYGNGRRMRADRRIVLSGRQRQRVEERLCGDMRGEIALDDLARDCGLSPATFLKAFRNTFGTSPHRFVLNQRIESACERMVASSANLSEIARDCGFFDQSHFTRAFAKAKGTTPSRWRSSRLA